MRVAQTYLGHIDKLERDDLFFWQAARLLKQASHWLTEAVSEGANHDDVVTISGEIIVRGRMLERQIIEHERATVIH
jgi:hypothetical protein